MCVHGYGCGERGECLWGYNHLRIYPDVPARLIKANLSYDPPSALAETGIGRTRANRFPSPRRNQLWPGADFSICASFCFLGWVWGGGGGDRGKHEGSKSRTRAPKAARGCSDLGFHLGPNCGLSPRGPGEAEAAPPPRKAAPRGAEFPRSEVEVSGRSPRFAFLQTHSSFPAAMQNTSPRSFFFLYIRIFNLI